ncbi:putative bifunctional diguanylate cyclase/phosphodiesterase [Gorillibacterium sp. sgz500922]|uniref:putative bifunctional diguanylate cyclase/phosphodiesterase n=1 Tax=Gorillibacterium sp. sgz500922 TaxID=3446694 RepID=UPI003F673607
MKDKNYFTRFLFGLGIIACFHLVFFLFQVNNNWMTILPIIVVSILFQIVPILLPGGLSFNGSGVVVLYLLLFYPFGASVLAISINVLAFFFIWTPDKRKINWFKALCNFGVNYASVLICSFALTFLPDMHIVLRAIVSYIIFEISQLLLWSGITKSINVNKEKFNIKYLIKVQLPTSFGLIMLIKTVVQVNYIYQWIELLFAVFVMTIINRYTNSLTKQYRLAEESNQRYMSLFQQNPDIVFTLDSKQIITSVNPMMERILGYTDHEVVGKPIDQAFHILEMEQFRDKLGSLFQGEPQHFPLTIYHKDGILREFEVTSGPTIVDNLVVGIYGIAKDRTAEREAERIIHRMAYYDSVTGLPNRAFFHKKLDELLEVAQANNGRFGLLYLDLDQFKNINDTQGHHSGDNLLSQVSGRILEAIHSASFISRLGGDEFTVLLSRIQGEEECIRVARSIQHALSAPFHLNDQDIYLTTSIGISIYPESGLDSQTLVKNADTAMYKAKDSGGDGYCLYTAELQNAIEERMILQNNLRRAMEKEEFFLVYQPQLDLTSGQVIGVEALIRWESPELGHVTPARFIPEAERSRLILPIGEWVLREACRQCKAWQEQGFPAISIAVNLSSVQFLSDDIVETVRGALIGTGLAPRYLELEITEGILLQNTNRTMRLLRELKEIGVRISIDDFGVGYSSLSYLKHFPFDTLKIDRSFIQEMHQDPKDQLIIGSLINLAHNLAMKVVAEGVETEEQLQYLKEHDCDLVQGYLISRPIPAESLEKGLWIAKSIVPEG